MLKSLNSKDDMFKLKTGDQFTRSNRRTLFTGPEIGNTYQRGINWIGTPPNYELVIIKSKLSTEIKLDLGKSPTYCLSFVIS